MSVDECLMVLRETVMKAKSHASEEKREQRMIERERESFGEWFLLDALIRVGEGE